MRKINTPKKKMGMLQSEEIRQNLEIISEKTRYKIVLTLFSSEKSLSFSELKSLLPSIEENSLNYHLKILKDGGLIKNSKKTEYKRAEPRSFYSLNAESISILDSLGLSTVKKEFQTLFKQIT